MLGRDRDAVAAYDICRSLRPEFYGTYFNRGQVLFRLSRGAEAEADFDRALKARPAWADAHFQRAVAREIQGRYADALADLDRALELGYTPTSVYLVRSRVHGRRGEKEAAERDFAEGIKTVPADERGWLARAQARLFRDPPAALADYEAALKLNPRLVYALQGKAHLLSRVDKNREAADALTRLIDVNPDVPDAWSGRGVLKARLNDRDGALADAREALRLSEGPATKYQVAGIYALTARTHPEDRREALSLLDTALRAGFGFEYLADDPELDPLRKDPEFEKTVDAARKYRESLKRRD
jgi:tetratricopeptide (TPR) repeat protein